MADGVSPVSPNLSVPYSGQHKFHSPFAPQELDMSAQYDISGGSSTNSGVDHRHYTGNSVHVETLERDSVSDKNIHAPIYDRLDNWFGGRLDLEYVLVFLTWPLFLL